MPQYTLGVPNCAINAVRSRDADTLVASMGLRVLNAQGGLHHDWPAQLISLGDFEAHTLVDTNMFYRDVDVPDATPDLPDGGAVYWSFLLVNAGHADSSAIVGALNNAANAVVGALVSSGNIVAEVAAGAIIGTQALVQLLTAGCDGTVAAFGLAFTAAELSTMSTDPANWITEINCPGTGSAVGCGGNSNYDVSYLVANRSTTTVPQLVGRPPQAAHALAQQSGLFLSEISSQTGFPNQAPRVDSQTPDPGSQVSPGTWMEVTVIYPVPHGHEVP